MAEKEGYRETLSLSMEIISYPCNGLMDIISLEVGGTIWQL